MTVASDLDCRSLRWRASVDSFRVCIEALIYNYSCKKLTGLNMYLSIFCVHLSIFGAWIFKKGLLAEREHGRGKNTSSKTLGFKLIVVWTKIHQWRKLWMVENLPRSAEPTKWLKRAWGLTWKVTYKNSVTAGQGADNLKIWGRCAASGPAGYRLHW